MSPTTISQNRKGAYDGPRKSVVIGSLQRHMAYQLILVLEAYVNRSGYGYKRCILHLFAAAKKFKPAMLSIDAKEHLYGAFDITLLIATDPQKTY